MNICHFVGMSDALIRNQLDVLADLCPKSEYMHHSIEPHLIFFDNQL